MIPLLMLFLSNDFSKYIDLKNPELTPYLGDRKDHKKIPSIVFDPNQSYETIESTWNEMETNGEVSIGSSPRFSLSIKPEDLNSPAILEVLKCDEKFPIGVISDILNSVKSTKHRLAFIYLSTSKPGKEWLHFSYTMMEIEPKRADLLQPYLQVKGLVISDSALLCDK